VSQPLNQRETHPLLGPLDAAAGEFWMRNPWEALDENLSAFERNRLLWNVDGTKFVDVSHLSGADLDSDSRGVAVGDFNSDGMPDLIVRSVGGGPLRVFENRLPPAHWLQVSLVGVDSNRRGVGAKLKLEAGDKTLWRDLFPICSYRSQLASSVHFGLGQAERVDRLTIYWPSGLVQTLAPLAVDRHVKITEGVEPSPRDGQ